jgi:hypothetical protein
MVIPTLWVKIYRVMVLIILSDFPGKWIRSWLHISLLERNEVFLKMTSEEETIRDLTGFGIVLKAEICQV